MQQDDSAIAVELNKLSGNQQRNQLPFAPMTRGDWKQPDMTPVCVGHALNYVNHQEP